MIASRTAERAQVRATQTNFAGYHKVTPPPNTFRVFVGRRRPAAVIEAISAALEMERLILERRPVLVLAHWRREACKRAGREVVAA